MTVSTQQEAAPGREGLVNLSLFATVVFSWGFSWIALKLQVGVVAPEVSLVYRFALGALIMMAWVALSGRPMRFPPQAHLRFAGLGLTLFCTNFYMFYNAAFYMASGLLSVIFSAASLINIILGVIIFRERPSLRTLCGVLIGIAGIVLLFGPKILATEASGDLMLGVGLALLGTLSFCTGNMLSSANQKRGLPVISANAWGMVYGTCFLTILALINGAEWQFEPTLEYTASLVFLSVVASVIAFGSYLTLLGRIGASRAAYATVMFPVIALTVSAIFEDYRFTLLGLLGFGLVALGNILVLRGGRKAKQPAAATG